MQIYSDAVVPVTSVPERDIRLMVCCVVGLCTLSLFLIFHEHRYHTRDAPKRRKTEKKKKVQRGHLSGSRLVCPKMSEGEDEGRPCADIIRWR